MTARSVFTRSVILTCGLFVGCRTLPTASSHVKDSDPVGLQTESRWSPVADTSVTPHTTVTTATLITAVRDPVGKTAEPTKSALERPAESGVQPPPRCLDFSDDRQQLPREFACDFESVWTRENVAVLLAAGGVSYALHETLDDDVAANVTRHRNRWGKGQEFFAGIGNPGHHFAAIGALYAYSLHAQDDEAHELSKTLFDAVSITGLSTIFLKATIGTSTRAPNREPDPFGGAWPSGHTSSTFAFAAVLDEYYGARVGIPAYLLAGLAGWERLDDGEHDLSDVVFGAALGYVIGKAVAGEHLSHFCGMELQPHIDPVTGTSGVAFERRF